MSKVIENDLPFLLWQNQEKIDMDILVWCYHHSHFLKLNGLWYYDIIHSKRKKKKTQNIWDHQFITEEKEPLKKSLLDYKYSMYVPYIYLQKYNYLNFG